MGSIISKVSVGVFEIVNELFVAVAAGILGVVILTCRGISGAHYSRTIFITSLTVGCLLYVFQSSDLAEPSPDKVVFITGCDSGLGFSLAQHISELGFTVLAGCLKLNSKGAKELKKLNRIIIVELDITNTSHVETAAETAAKYIESRRYTLWALINNSGCMVFGEFEWLTPDLIKEQINVNLLGSFTVTKIFSPLVRKYESRIIIISSHCALATLPGLSVYGATKAGLLAWSDGLRVELGKYGVKVVSFVPGSFIQHSNIMSKHSEHVLEMSNAFTHEQRRFYSDYFKRYNAHLNFVTGQINPKKIEDPTLYNVFENALMANRPKALYIHENWKYKLYHTIFKYAPTAIRDYCVVQFMQMPYYKDDPFVPEGLA